MLVERKSLPEATDVSNVDLLSCVMDIRLCKTTVCVDRNIQKIGLFCLVEWLRFNVENGCSLGQGLVFGVGGEGVRALLILPNLTNDSLFEHRVRHDIANGKSTKL